MTWAHGAVLLLLALLVPGAWLAVRRERRRARELRAFGDPALVGRLSPLPARRERLARHGLRLAGLGLGLVALAGPQVGERPAGVVRTGRDLLVLLDLSRSMNAADVRPSRLAAAKRIAAELAARSPGDRLGLVVFGGSAFLQLPLTPDHDAFRRFLEAASTDNLGDPSTDLSSALAAAAKAFEHEGAPGYRAAVLLSDGESEGDPAAALARLRREDIPVFAIGVGTPAGAPVPADSSEAPEPYHRDPIGRIVVSHLEEGDLRRAALATGGAYARWDDRAAMAELGARLARLEARPILASRATRRTERYQWPLGLALLALALEPVVGLRRRARLRHAWAAAHGPAVAAALALAFTACTAARESRRGERLYDAGSYRDAYRSFQRALDASADPALEYNAAAALYRMKRYDEAARRFRNAAGGPPRLRERSQYNLGNALVRAAEDAAGGRKAELLGQAIAAYEEALRLDPADADARWNLELALRRRGDEPGGSSAGRTRRGDYGPGRQNVPGYEGNPEAAVGAMAGGGFGSGEGESVEELSPSAARRLLDAVQREQLATHLGRRAGGGRSGERDW